MILYVNILGFFVILFLLFFLFKELTYMSTSVNPKEINRKFQYKNNLIAHIKYEKNENKDDFLDKYLGVMSYFISKSSESIYIYNFFSEKKISKSKGNLNLTAYYRKYYKILENIIERKKLNYTRIYQTSKIQDDTTSTDTMKKIVLKNFYNETLNHFNRMFEIKDNFFFIMLKGGWRYNFMVIDNDYLLIEHYQRDKSDKLIPDQLFVYESLKNNKNDIVKSYKKQIDNFLLNKREMDSVKKKFFNHLLNNIQKDNKREIEEVQVSIQEINKLHSILENKKKHSTELDRSIESKEKDIKLLSRNIEILNKELRREKIKHQRLVIRSKTFHLKKKNTRIQEPLSTALR